MNFESARETRLQGARGKRRFGHFRGGVQVYDPLTETSSFDSDRTLLH